MPETKKKQKFYPGHLKQTVVEDVLQNGLSYRAAEKKYDVSNSLIIRWERLYLANGPEYLHKNHRGLHSHRPKGTTNSKDIRIIKIQKQLETIDDTPLSDNERTELFKLRVENAYLKKLQALVLK